MQRKYKKKNDSRFEIKLPDQLKTDFFHCCELLDVPVAEVIRVLMSDFLKENDDFVLTNGGWGVKSNSAKKVLRKKAKREKDKEPSIPPLSENISSDAIPAFENVYLSREKDADLFNEIDQIHREAEKRNVVESLDVSGMFLDTSRQKPSFGNPNLSRKQRRAIESNERKKNKKKR